MSRILLAAATCATLISGCIGSPASAQFDPYDSGGPLMPEQAAYDVSFYDLSLTVRPEERAIEGQVRVVASVHSPIDWFVLDLDPILEVRGIAEGDLDLAFQRRGGRLWIKLPFTRQPGEAVDLTVRYGGVPLVATNPPWTGGFTWKTTPSGAHWIATTAQSEGADIWWPVKEHVSDEPDSMGVTVRVPAGLVVATNGRLVGVDDSGDSWTTYRWFISTPINTYNVALNIAPYVVLEDTFESVAGDSVPVQFFVLPEDEARGRAFLPEILDHLRFFETNLGPYPFRADKYGVAQTPHLGMEHQSIIAYGAGFDNGAMTGGRDWGFDALHHHELSHEWWGNLVTNSDWKDMWLHEGLGSYMQPLYLEQTQGPDAAAEYLMSSRRGISNRHPVAPREVTTSNEVYGGDIYSKGAWILHTLRYLVGDTDFFVLLRRMAYPDPAMEATSDGSACRYATTDDFVRLAEEVTGRDLAWFFEVYLRQPDLPSVQMKRDGDSLHVSWNVPDDLFFPMPVDVRIGDAIARVDVPVGGTTLEVGAEEAVRVDPENRVLRRGNRGN